MQLYLFHGFRFSHTMLLARYAILMFGDPHNYIGRLCHAYCQHCTECLQKTDQYNCVNDPGWTMKAYKILRTAGITPMAPRFQRNGLVIENRNYFKIKNLA